MVPVAQTFLLCHGLFARFEHATRWVQGACCLRACVLLGVVYRCTYRRDVNDRRNCSGSVAYCLGLARKQLHRLAREVSRVVVHDAMGSDSCRTGFMRGSAGQCMLQVGWATLAMRCCASHHLFQKSWVRAV